MVLWGFFLGGGTFFKDRLVSGSWSEAGVKSSVFFGFAPERVVFCVSLNQVPSRRRLLSWWTKEWTTTTRSWAEERKPSSGCRRDGGRFWLGEGSHYACCLRTAWWSRETPCCLYTTWYWWTRGHETQRFYSSEAESTECDLKPPLVRHDDP